MARCRYAFAACLWLCAAHVGAQSRLALEVQSGDGLGDCVSPEALRKVVDGLMGSDVAVGDAPPQHAVLWVQVQLEARAADVVARVRSRRAADASWVERELPPQARCQRLVDALGLVISLLASEASSQPSESAPSSAPATSAPIPAVPGGQPAALSTAAKAAEPAGSATSMHSKRRRQPKAEHRTEPAAASLAISAYTLRWLGLGLDGGQAFAAGAGLTFDVGRAERRRTVLELSVSGILPHSLQDEGGEVQADAYGMAARLAGCAPRLSPGLPIELCAALLVVAQRVAAQDMSGNRAEGSEVKHFFELGANFHLQLHGSLWLGLRPALSVPFDPDSVSLQRVVSSEETQLAPRGSPGTFIQNAPSAPQQDPFEGVELAKPAVVGLRITVVLRLQL